LTQLDPRFQLGTKSFKILKNVMYRLGSITLLYELVAGVDLRDDVC